MNRNDSLELDFTDRLEYLQIDRRDFLKTAGALGVGALLVAACKSIGTESASQSSPVSTTSPALPTSPAGAPPDTGKLAAYDKPLKVKAVLLDPAVVRTGDTHLGDVCARRAGAQARCGRATPGAGGA